MVEQGNWRALQAACTGDDLQEVAVQVCNSLARPNYGTQSSLGLPQDRFP